MKKSGVLLVIILILALSSVSVYADGHVIPCETNDDCPPSESCQYYEEYYAEYGNVCGVVVVPFCGLSSSDGCAGCLAGEENPPCANGVVPLSPACEFRSPQGSENCADGGGSCCLLVLPDEPFNIFNAFLGFDIAGNLLQNKLLFTLHVIKESIFQTELKVIETSLAQYSCADQPLSFRISKDDYRYGKLEEIDALINKLLLITENNPGQFGLSFDDVSTAQNLVEQAENFLDEGDYSDAFHCKYWAYQSLIGKPVNAGAEDCFCFEDQQEPECPSGQIPNGELCPIGCGSCPCESGGFVLEGFECPQDE